MWLTSMAAQAPAALSTSCMGLMPVRATFSLSIITRWPSGVSPMNLRPPRPWSVVVRVFAMRPAYPAPGRRLAPEHVVGTTSTPGPGPDGDKPAWRAWAREARSAVAGEGLGAAVAGHLLAWDRYLSARALGVYLAFGTEVDLSAVI